SASPAQARSRKAGRSAGAWSRAARKSAFAWWGSTGMACSFARSALQCDVRRGFVSGFPEMRGAKTPPPGKSGRRDVGLVLQGAAEPGAGVGPVAVRVGPRDREGV